MKTKLTEEQKLELENLKQKKISELTKEEINARLNSLASVLSFDVVICYLLHVIDEEYALSESKADNLAAKKFLSDKRLNKYREEIFKHS